MRTTLTLDDDVAARIRAEKRLSGKAFNTVVNDQLRRSLALRRIGKEVVAFRVEPRNLGGPQPGRSYDSISALLADVEGP